MEYLSLPHTRASSHKLVPEVDDMLLTNLRNPIISLVEDTTPGAHDTLTAACDANLYTALGIDKPEEHGSCAENLVLALKELNENAGLKGAKAIGADISVNIAPTPLHLFMNAPLQLPTSESSSGAGAKGISIAVEEPQGKKRSFVRFRAERDVVMVFSACPMEIGKQNGGRCMAANFMVEDVQEGEDLASSAASIGKKRGTPKKLGGSKAAKATEDKKKVEDKAEKAAPKPPADKKPAEQKKPTDEKKPAEDKKTPARRDSATTPAATGPPNPTDKDKKPSPIAEEDAKPKKKPKKLQVRSAAATPAAEKTAS